MKYIFEKEFPRRQFDGRSVSGSLLIALWFCLLVYSGCKSDQADQHLPAATAVKDAGTHANDSLHSLYSALRLQMDELATKNTRLDSQIIEKDAAIYRLKYQVAHLSESNRRLNAELKKDKKMIASLEQEISDKARNFAEKIGLLQNERDQLAAQRDDYRDRYNKVKTLASVLHASNFRLQALHLKHSGKEKKTRKARKADVLRIFFDIDENRVAEDGTKSLYLAISDPEGQLLKDATGSGVFSNNNGAQTDFSILRQIDLKREEPVKNVIVDWKQEKDYEKGVYRIAIYNGGYKIGGGDVFLN